MGARTALEQVLLNLVGNAVKHHDRGTGRVTLACRDMGTRIELTVSDDGPGIAPDLHLRAFGMFQTFRPRDEVEGSGMGLAIVKRLVEVHGGEIALESDGRGTTFRFTWPKPSAAPVDV